MDGDSGLQVFDGIVGVFDAQLYVASDTEEIGPDLYTFFRGQSNGLLGAAQSAVLCLLTGKADGDIGLTVGVAAREPELDDSWEDCVEASFSPTAPIAVLCDLERKVVTEVPLGEQTYRVRYAARGMDEGDSGTEMDVYGLWFWPAPAAPDAIIRQTSKSAAYWHAEMERVNSVLSEPPES
jgi:hypothetical protein